MKHKHADLIHAWADGAKIEVKIGVNWEPACYPGWYSDSEYRIKPEEPEYMPNRGDVVVMSLNGSSWFTRDFYEYHSDDDYPHMDTEGERWKHCKPHPIQRERDRYKKALEEIIEAKDLDRNELASTRWEIARDALEGDKE